MSSIPLVEFDRVGKVYRSGLRGSRSVTAIADISFQIQPGEVFGLLGPNRAGKTTLVKILLSLCRPTQGRALRFGKPTSDPGTLARIGYMHENQAFPRYHTAGSLLEYYGCLALMEELRVRKRAQVLLDLVGLADRSREPIARFSKGMVQRLALAQALMNEPELLVLDEPTEGLDLNGRMLVHEIVNRQRSQGRSVLLVSHSLADVEQLCDRVGVLVNGRLVHLGPLADLLSSTPATAPATPDSQDRSSLEQALSELYQKAS